MSSRTAQPRLKQNKQPPQTHTQKFPKTTEQDSTLKIFQTHKKNEDSTLAYELAVFIFLWPLELFKITKE